MDDAHIRALVPVAPQRTFALGEVLRAWGAHASDMFIVLDGEVVVDFEDSNRTTVTVGRFQPLGEMGFLTGRPAIARLTAASDVTVMVVDGAVLSALGRDDPEMAVRVQRALAQTAAARSVANEEMLGDAGPTPDTIEVRRCTDAESLGIAQALRYDVYVGEFGRASPNANHDNGTLVDALDKLGVTFLAYHEGRPIGSARVNYCDDPDLGMLHRLYDLQHSPYDLSRAAAITKYAIRDGYRGGATYVKLFAAMATYMHGRDTDAVYIDCVPPLARFYATMGFERCAEDFVHVENGLSVPMVLDGAAYSAKMPIEERIAKNHWR